MSTKATEAIVLPCGHSITEAEILRLAGRISSARRTTRAAGPGRPRTAQRCPCGAMTLTRAKGRNHKCQPPQ